MTMLMSTIFRGVHYRCDVDCNLHLQCSAPRAPISSTVGAKSNTVAASCKSACHRQSALPPTCPWPQVEVFQSTRCACLQCGCARRARRAGARASCCAPFVRFLSVQLRMKVTFQPPLSSSANPAPSALGIRLARTINATGEDHICVQSASTVQ